MLQTELSEVKTFNAYHFDIDIIGNYYFQTDNTIIKIEALNNKINYKNPILGSPDIVDISNPFKILVYYKNYNRLLFLNNQLSIIGQEIFLDNLQLFNIDAICSSSFGGFWIYDNNIKKIKHISNSLIISNESISLINILPDNEYPYFLTEKNNSVYLGYKSKGIFVFNNSLKFIRLLPILSDIKPVIEQNKIFYLANDSIFEYDMNYAEKNFLMSWDKQTSNIGKNGNKLYLYSENNLYIFKIKI